MGLPLAIALASHHSVRIYDIDTRAVERVRRGEMPFRDAGADEGLREALRRGLVVSDSPSSLDGAEVLVVVIGTPVDEHLNPSFALFDTLLAELAEYMRDGQTLILRSTVYPGTSERVHQMLKERGLKVEVAFCPERVAEGVALEEIRKLPQIISGFSPRGLEVARTVFAPLGVDLLELSPLEGELTKLFNNVYRYITFAVANQFYMLSAEWNIDFHRILHALKFNYPRAAHMPAPGFAAGPCLLKDNAMAATTKPVLPRPLAMFLAPEGLPRSW